MKIAYISEHSPLDLNNWSGTPYYVYKTLSENHTVVWLGEGMCNGAYWHHRFLLNRKPFFIHDYSKDVCKMLSDAIRAGGFDIVLTSTYTMASDLDVDVPIVYFSDIVYILCKDNYFPMPAELEKRAILCEGKALRRADKIIFSSETVKRTAMDFYNLPEEKIHVFDFGANIPDPQNVVPEIYDKNICRLTFVGRDWERKGGEKMLQTFRILKKQGFPCELTIIGSVPKEEIDDSDIKVIPFLDKKKAEDLTKYDEILRKSHFMVLPTRYDAYGILFCEASAYGVPSIAADVGGVSQPVKEGINGFLLSHDATAEDYAKKIREVFENQEMYLKLRQTSLREYLTRLNWNVWGRNVIALMENLVAEYKKKPTRTKDGSICADICLPVYAINLKSRPDRLENLKRQFASKPEFDVTYIDAVQHENGAVGLWKSICKAVRLAQQRGEDVIIICEDDHEFTNIYDKEMFLASIVGAYRQGAELLNGGIGGFGTAVPVSPTRCWVDWFWCTQFVVIFASLFPKIVTYDFRDTDTADGVLSKLSSQSLAMYPPISRQKDYGYSDITPRESQSEFQNNIFKIANQRLKQINDVYRYYHQPQIISKGENSENGR